MCFELDNDIETLVKQMHQQSAMVKSLQAQPTPVKVSSPLSVKDHIPEVLVANINDGEETERQSQQQESLMKPDDEDESDHEISHYLQLRRTHDERDMEEPS